MYIFECGAGYSGSRSCSSDCCTASHSVERGSIRQSLQPKKSIVIMAVAMGATAVAGRNSGSDDLGGRLRSII